MDEKTEELRDIFMSVSDETTVTERQEETPGSLTADRPDAEQIDEIIADMREQYDFETDRPAAEYRRVVREFFDGADDEAIAEALGIDEETVFRARMDLHLVTDADLDPSFDAEAARDRLEADDPETVARGLDADPAAVARYGRALAARNEALRANHRYRDRFEELLGDGDLARRMASEVREDGLEEATEGMETDVSF